MNRGRFAGPALILLAGGLAGCLKNLAYLNTSWGMSEKALKSARPALEAGAEPDRNPFRFEKTSIDGLKATVTYQVGAGGLERVNVAFDPVSGDKEQYVDHYRQIKALLSEKYGEPEVDAAGVAVMAQKYRIQREADYQSKCVWRTRAALIQLTCEGGCDGSSNGNSIMISYEPPSARTEGL